MADRSVEDTIWIAVGLSALLLADPVLAHTGEGVTGGFASGFTHPIRGIDHVIAMVAVGLWGAFLGMPALWLLPVVFPLVMALGGVLGIFSVPLPSVETGIALSAVVLGVMVAFAARPPLWIAAALVGISQSFTAMRTVPKCQPHPMLSPMPWAS
jgi:urease accessory protein